MKMSMALFIVLELIKSSKHIPSQTYSSAKITNQAFSS